MYFFTHLFIAKVLYQHLSETVDLDYKAFSYGNIKPDLPSTTRKHHTLDNYLETVCIKADSLKEEEMTVEDFSEELGEICHYISDFFCYYHLNETLHKRSLKHFSYEILTHLTLFPNRISENYSFTTPLVSSGISIEETISTMREQYFQKEKSIKRDMEFALSTSLLISEAILDCVQFSTPASMDLEMADQRMISLSPMVTL